MKARNVALALLMAAPLLAGHNAWAQIKIGFVAPLTGPSASDGKAAEIGARIAIDWANAAGGVLGQKLELVTYDDQGKADQAIPIANKLIGQDKVVATVSGSYSLPARAAAPVFQKAGVPYFAAFAVHPDVTAGGNFAFRGVPLAQAQGEAAAAFVGKEFGGKKVALVTMDNDFGKAIKEGFKSYAPKVGVSTTKDFNFALNERQFGSVVAGLKAEKPDVIMITAYYFVGGPLVTQIRAAGLTQPIVGTQPFDAPQFISIAKKAADGIFVVNALARDNKHPDYRKFANEFETRAKFPVENVAVMVYDATKMTIEAIRKAGAADPRKIRDALAATREYPAIMGTIHEFSASGELYTALEVAKIEDGTYKHHMKIDDAAILQPKK